MTTQATTFPVVFDSKGVLLAGRVHRGARAESGRLMWRVAATGADRQVLARDS